MRSATSNEIDYLGTIQGNGSEDRSLIRELSQRLDALRRYDQCFSEADWHPHGPQGGQGSSGRSPS